VPLIRVETAIEAAAERCFDLVRCVEVHLASTAGTGERAVAGVTSGLLELDDEVTWEAVHLGVRQHLTARITRFEPPYLLEDQMVRGAFRKFTHVHEFHPVDNGTLMVDLFDYTSPLGLLGRVADWLFLERYMRTFLVGRAVHIKYVAERPAATA
jgi:ligand-binding SRPBCC domain-containing protein